MVCSICWDVDHNRKSCHMKALPQYYCENNNIKKKKDKDDNIMDGRKRAKKDEDSILCIYNSIEIFLNDISNININKHGSETQTTGSEHEKTVSNIIKNNFKAENIEKKAFRDFIKMNGNGRQWKSGTDSFNRICDESLEIKNNSLKLIDGKNYIIDQPSGGQDYPDCVMIRLNKNILQFVYIECKGLIPKFNNNPPK